jgi:hypothetical protein
VPGPDDDDGGVGGSSGTPKKDAGTMLPKMDADVAPDTGPINTPTKLGDGDISVVGVTSDNNVVFLTFGTKVTLQVIPLAGGAPAMLNPDVKLTGGADDDSFQVSGGVVGIWSAVTATGSSKLQVWTKANGLKDVSTTAPAVDSIAGSKDGTQVAFVRTVGTEDQLALSPTTLAGTPTVVDAALGRGTAGTPCNPNFRFADKYLVSLTCGGTRTTADLRRTEAATVTTVSTTRFDPDALDVSTAGDKILVSSRLTAAATTGRATLFAVAADNTVTTRFIEANVTSLFLDPAGAFAVYATRTGSLKRAAAAAGAGIDLTTGIKGILSASTDGKFVVTNKLDAVMDASDLQLSSTAAAAAPTVLVATAIGLPAGFTANGSHVLFIGDKAAPKLLARPTAGGADRDLGAAIGLARVPGSSKLMIESNPTTVKVGTSDVDVSDFSIVDLAGTAAPVVVAKGVKSASIAGAGNVLYTQAAGGLFAAPIP